MKITVWLATRHHTTWIALAESIVLAAVVATGQSGLWRWVGLLLVGHLGYRAVTSLPMGLVPGRPTGSKQQRRNQDLRSRVVGFLNEVRRVEAYAQRARAGRVSRDEVQRTLVVSQRRMMKAAAEVAKATGRITIEPDDDESVPSTGGLRVLVHDRSSGSAPSAMA